MAAFAPIPPVPVTGEVLDWQARTLKPLVQNVELLCGLRNENDRASQAIVASDISLGFVPAQNITSASTLPSYTTTFFTASTGVQVLKYNTESATIPSVINVAARYPDAVLLLQELENLRVAVATIAAILRK